MGFRSLVITGFPVEEKEKGFEILPKEDWSEIVEKDEMIFCKNDWNWKWGYGFEIEKKWDQFMCDLEDKYEDERYFTIVIGEDCSFNHDSSWNYDLGLDYGFGIDVNTVGSVFKK